MAVRCSSAVKRIAVSLLAIVQLGCAARREARVRRAWNAQRATAEDPSANGSDGSADEDPDSPAAVAPKEGWDKVEELLTRTADVLTTAPSPEVLAELATKWCEVEPIPRKTEHGEVRVCYLYPPVRVQGIALTLELSETGVIGFVAPDVDAVKSQELATEARRTLEPLCAQSSWTTATAGLDVQTCEVEGGSTLAVGRLQARPDSDRWQVSVAVLGAI